MTLEGLDLSQYQPTTPPLAGKAFMIARATYDVHPDSRFAQHLGNAKAAGLVTGGYHFATGRSTASQQAAAFLKAAQGADLLFVDWEGDAVPASSSVVRAIIAAVHAAGRRIGLYHSESGFPGLGQDFDWVAHWGVAAPSRDWQFHQYTSDGSVPGYSGRLDLDRFNGTIDDLHRLAGILPPKTWSVRIAAGAQVMVATVTATGQIAGWTTRQWGRNASSAPCREPVVKQGTHSGAATVAYVTRGAFSGRWVRIGDGVTAVPSGGDPQSAPTPAPTPAPAPASKIPVISTTPTHVQNVQSSPLDVMPPILWQTESVVPNGYGAYIRHPADRSGSAPVWVLVHGGPLKVGDPDNMGNVVGGWLASRGHVVLSIDYPALNPDATGAPFAAAAKAVTDAIAWAQANAARYGGDPKRILLAAHSFGGYLALPVAFGVAGGPAPIAYASIDCVDTASGFPDWPVQPLASLLRTVPTLVVEGSADIVGQTQSAAASIAASLAGHGVPGRYIVVDGADHTQPLSAKPVIDALVQLAEES